MDMDGLTWVLFGIAVICVIVLLVCSALEPEAQSALITEPQIALISLIGGA